LKAIKKFQFAFLSLASLFLSNGKRGSSEARTKKNKKFQMDFLLTLNKHSQCFMEKEVFFSVGTNFEA
jgi:hypothetical protein